MNQRQKAKAARRKSARSISRLESTGLLTFDELMQMKDVVASEGLPPFREFIEYKLRVNGADAAEVQVIPELAGDRDSGRALAVLIKTAGSLEESPPRVVRGRYLTLQSLNKATRHTAQPLGHRPAWLDQIYVPKVRPVRIHGRYWSSDVRLRPLTLELTLAGWPWTAIGKLIIQRRGQATKFGSGVLVGPNLLLTASHAMPWDTGDYSVRFVPAYRAGNNPAFGHAYVDDWLGIRHAPQGNVTGLDYVICKLNWRIGDRAGWLGSWYWDDEDPYYAGSWFSVGYPLSVRGGEYPAVEFAATVEDIDNDADGIEIETDNFVDFGWSGGPLWGWINNDPKVIGIASGTEKDLFDPTRSVFSGGKPLVDLVRVGLARWS